MSVRKINVDGVGKLPAFCHASVAGDFIYVSGTLGTQPGSFELVEGGTGPETTQTLRNMAQVLVDAGADLVNGHGAHLVQGVEDVEGVPVLYSLGNFVFGSSGRYESLSPDLRLSVLARYVFDDATLQSIELLPIQTDNGIVQWQPREATEEQANEQLAPVLQRYDLEWTRRADGWWVHER